MSESKGPERIWAYDIGLASDQVPYGRWHTRTEKKLRCDHEYIRADLYAAAEKRVAEYQQKLRELRGFTVGLIQGFDCTDPESAVPALRELLDRFDAAIRKGADDG